MTTEQPDLTDEELDAFLNKEQPLATAYPASQELPPAALDAKIREQAGTLPAVVAPKSARWMRPMAAAAVLVLCVSVVLSVKDLGDGIIPIDQEGKIENLELARQAVIEDAGPAPRKSVAPTSEPMPIAAADTANAATQSDDMASEIMAPSPALVADAEERADFQASGSQRLEQVVLGQTAEKKAYSVMARQSNIAGLRQAITVDIESRLERVELLVVEGELEAASATLAIFRVDYPDYPERTLRERLPKELFEIEERQIDRPDDQE